VRPQTVYNICKPKSTVHNANHISMNRSQWRADWSRA